ncbi:MAG: hypothetical protein ABIG20_01805 [archaeon]
MSSNVFETWRDIKAGKYRSKKMPVRQTNLRIIDARKDLKANERQVINNIFEDISKVCNEGLVTTAAGVVNRYSPDGLMKCLLAFRTICRVNDEKLTAQCIRLVIGFHEENAIKTLGSFINILVKEDGDREKYLTFDKDEEPEKIKKVLLEPGELVTLKLTLVKKEPERKIINVEELQTVSAVLTKVKERTGNQKLVAELAYDFAEAFYAGHNIKELVKALTDRGVVKEIMIALGTIFDRTKEPLTKEEARTASALRKEFLEMGEVCDPRIIKAFFVSRIRKLKSA